MYASHWPFRRHALISLLLIALLGLTVGAQAAEPPRCLTECSPRLGVISAFGQEADLLIAQLQEPQDYRINGKRFTTGYVGAAPVVVVLSGISMPNAVMTTQLLFDHFRIEQLVFSGIAGGLNPKYKVGDVLVPRSWVMQQEVYYANSTELPVPCGQAGDLSCLGLKLADVPPYDDGLFLRKTNVINERNHERAALRDSVTDAVIANGEMRLDYPVDPAMLKIARGLTARLAPQLEPICAAPGDCRAPVIALGRRGVAGGMFLANVQYRAYLEQQLRADCVDMETAGVAHVAYANQVPYIAFRSVSDLAGADFHPEVGQFFGSGIAQRNAARVTLGFIEAWAKERIHKQ